MLLNIEKKVSNLRMDVDIVLYFVFRKLACIPGITYESNYIKVIYSIKKEKSFPLSELGLYTGIGIKLCTLLACVQS